MIVKLSEFNTIPNPFIHLHCNKRHDRHQSYVLSNHVNVEDTKTNLIPLILLGGSRTILYNFTRETSSIMDIFFLRLEEWHVELY